MVPKTEANPHISLWEDRKNRGITVFYALITIIALGAILSLIDNFQTFSNPCISCPIAAVILFLSLCYIFKDKFNLPSISLKLKKSSLPKTKPKKTLLKKSDFSTPKASAHPISSAIDFSKITPKNYEQYIYVEGSPNDGPEERGDCIFYKQTLTKNCSVTKDLFKEGDVYLAGTLITQEGGYYGGLGLHVHGDEFIHYPQWSAPPVRFSNLKDFFNYMFRGEYYQGEYARDMKFFKIRTIDGRMIRYDNPYLK